MGHANPLGAALEQILGGASAFLTAWQQAIVTAVFELCLVGVMVIYELLGQGRQAPDALRADQVQEPVQVVVDGSIDEIRSRHAHTASPATGRTTAKTPKANKRGSVKDFAREHLFPADGDERVAIKSLMHTYRAWCEERGWAPVSLGSFVDEIKKLCRKLGVRIEVGEDLRVYCLGVRIAAPPVVQVSVH